MMVECRSIKDIFVILLDVIISRSDKLNKAEADDGR